MKPLKYYLYLATTAISFIAHVTHAEIPAVQLSGTSSCMKPGYELYAPAIGALYWHSPYVRNLYEYGPDEHAMVQLTKKLFFVHHDNVTFDVTRSATKIANHFNSSDIGSIVGLIYMHKDKPDVLESELDKHIKKIVKNKNKMIKTQLKKMYKTAINRHSQAAQALVNTIINELSKEEQEKLKVHATQKPNWKNIKKFIRRKAFKNDLESPTRTKVNQLLKIIGRIRANEKLEKEEKTATEINNPHLQSDIGDKPEKHTFSFANTLSNALQEEQLGLYPKGTITGLLLAWLWKHSHHKIKLVSYLENFAIIQGKKPEQVFDMKTLEMPAYDQKTYEYLKNISIDGIQQLQMEKLLFAHLGYDLYGNPLPPKVDMVSYAQIKESDTFSDCVETTLRNFFNALLYDDNENKFNITLLEKLKAHSGLIKFYTIYNTTISIKTPKAHCDWAEIVSQIPGVKYNQKPGCNIKTSVINILKVIGHLLPGIKTFENLRKTLQANGVKIDFKWEAPLTKTTDNDNQLIISMENEDWSESELTWSFYPGHCELSYPTIGKAKYKDNYRKALAKTNSPLNSEQGRQNLMLRAQFGDQLKEINKKNKKNLSVLKTLFLMDTNLWTAQVTLAEHLVNLPHAFAKPIWVKIYKNLPHDIYFLHRFFEIVQPSTKKDNTFFNQLYLASRSFTHKCFFAGYILKNYHPLNQQKCKIIQEILETLPEIQQGDYIISQILRSSVPTNDSEKKLRKYLYKWTLNLLPHIEDTRKSNLIKRILERPVFTDAQEEKISQQLYTWMLNSLSTINAHEKRNIIESIINRTIYNKKSEIKLATVIYQWALNKLPKIEISDKLSIFKTILNRIFLPSEQKTKLPQQLYTWVQQERSNLVDVFGATNIVKTIVNCPIPESSDAQKFLAPIYQWAGQTTLKPDMNCYEITEILKTIIKKDTPSSTNGKKLLNNLHQLVQNTFSLLKKDYKGSSHKLHKLIIKNHPFSDDSTAGKNLNPLHKAILGFP